jgi:hypothetical protein
MSPSEFARSTTEMIDTHDVTIRTPNKERVSFAALSPRFGPHAMAAITCCNAARATKEPKGAKAGP